MKNVLIFFFLLNTAAAQSVSTGLSFLKLGVGARSVAMGESFTAVAGDHASLYYNPASLHFSNRHELMLMHKNWISETATDYLGATILGNQWNYGFSIHSTSVDDIEIRLIPGEPDGTFSVRNIALAASISYGVTEQLAIGLTGKFLYEKILIDEASGYGFDLGMLYTLDERFAFGISLQNVGSMNVLRDRASSLPTTVRLGSSYSSAVTDRFSGTVAMEAVKTIDDDHLHLHAGGEIQYDNFASLRAGYVTGYEFRSFSTGFGVIFSSVKFDYAFVPFSGAFNSTHTFSLSFLL
ncbi:MAG: PorV/PorQ family protein [Bacteroidota bacterium]